MILLSVEKLIKLCNVLDVPPWEEIESQPIDIQELRVRLSAGEFNQDPFFQYNPWQPQSRKFHIERIAFLAANGWNDAPIQMYFNHKGIYPLQDGAHRLAAAYLRDDEWIMSNWYGDINLMKKYKYE